MHVANKLSNLFYSLKTRSYKLRTVNEIVPFFFFTICCLCKLKSFSLKFYLVSQVRLHLLTAVMKCFFRRPPETQKALGAALAAGLADFHQVLVELHALLSFRIS